jgi:MFS superfamily sulfate permease-like transporter
MPGLQEAFYIVAIVFMGLMMAVMLGILIGIIIIGKKISHIQRTIQGKIDKVTAVAAKGAAVAKAVTRVIKHKKDH